MLISRAMIGSSGGEGEDVKYPVSEYVCKRPISLRSLPGNVYLNRGYIKVAGLKDHWTKENGYIDIANRCAYVNKAALTNFLGYNPDITLSVSHSEYFFAPRSTYIIDNEPSDSVSEVTIDGIEFVRIQYGIAAPGAVFYRYSERPSYINNSYITKTDKGELSYYIPSSPTSRGDKKLLPNPTSKEWIRTKIAGLIDIGDKIRRNRLAVLRNHCGIRYHLGVLKQRDMHSHYRFKSSPPFGRKAYSMETLKDNLDNAGWSVMSSKGHKWKRRGTKLTVWRKRNLAVYEKSEKVDVWVHTERPNDYVRFVSI
ncbi:MAG: hypothetical protein NC324_03025 [Bacteroides sp.]|nr:hypothetical protein [Bacteroides sp.]